MKTAVIFGSEGQDGRIAFDMLASKGYGVVGLGCGTARSSGIAWDQPVDLTVESEVVELIRTVKPNEIYYLAACHQSSQDRTPDDAALWKMSQQVNVSGLQYCLEAIKAHASGTRVFYASSSLIFENTVSEFQDEITPFAPASIYGITKLDGLLLARYYREKYGLFVSTGILFNHESPYRKENFLSKKLVKAAVNIKQGRQDQLVLGDLNAAIDWGYAPDYVEAMHRILNTRRADEFVIATGAAHTVRDFVQIAFEELGLDWTKYVKEDPSIVARKRRPLVGNPRKLMETTGWRPTVNFKEMVSILLQAEGVCV